jgi:hypothetical protein
MRWREAPLHQGHHADVAQMAERLTRNEQVRGSIPRVGFLHSSPMRRRKPAPAADKFGLNTRLVASGGLLPYTTGCDGLSYQVVTRL